jgi:hypothetical protein
LTLADIGNDATASIELFDDPDDGESRSVNIFTVTMVSGEPSKRPMHC